MSPATMTAETPAAVRDIAGAHGDGIGEEIAELGVPAQHQSNKSIDGDSERSNQGTADDETGKLREDGVLFGI